MSSSQRFSSYVREHIEELATEVVEEVVRRQDLKVPDWEKERARDMFIGLLGFIAATSEETEGDEIPRGLIAWSKKNAARQVRTEGAISEIIVRYLPTRTIFTEMFTRISIKLGLTLQELAGYIRQVNEMLDTGLNETVCAFERYTDQKRKETEQELAKLSAPIVPVADNIVVLPLIGKIDMERANYILENVVPELAERGTTHVISDYSGIYTIDTQIAEALGQIGNTLRLMGIRVIVAGLRPDLALSIVSSGLDLRRMEPYATVKQALEGIKKQ